MGFFEIFRRPKPKPEYASPAAVEQRQAVGPISEDWHPGQILLDDFAVQRVLGEGGMGKVYLVKSRTTNMHFAVKRARGLSEGERRNFLAELQTWIDPEHPNLVPCRFFRTVEDEVLIFAEYVGGGSLKNWIDSRKLYEGGAEETIERILDTATQFAWGLQCLHELGLVHQDVKPANVMMDKDAHVAVQGVKARVTDYGLARARVAAGEQHAWEVGGSILVSSGGYTPAYCSPEQVAGRKLDRRTDVWSWGVSVLEMFQGGVTWQSGRAAAEALEAFLGHNGDEEDIPAMPEDVAKLLEGCFREDPAQRWKSMDVIVQHLREVYQSAVGAEYRRVLDKVGRETAAHWEAYERRTHSAGSWRDPREWLERALRAEGRDPAEAANVISRYGRSRLGQLVADAATLDEARQTYERLVSSGRKDLEEDLAQLCRDAACVHELTGDSPGALALYDRAIEIRERLVSGGKRDLADGLALLYGNKGTLVGHLGDNRSAVALYDRAIEIFERLLSTERRRQLATLMRGALAGAYSDKALALQRLGDNDSAMIFYDRAIEVSEAFVDANNWREVAGMAIVYNNKAMLLGEHRADSLGAIALYDRAIQILERLVNMESRRELANYLADSYSNKALAVGKLGDKLAATALYDQAIKIREGLVHIDGRREFSNDLATAYSNKATVLMEIGDNQSAADMCDLAIAIRERLVNVEGRREFANDLATTYSNKAVALTKLGATHAALAANDRAIAIRERLVNVDGRRELALNLAGLYFVKATWLRELGAATELAPVTDRAIAIYERLVNVDGRRELIGDLAGLYYMKANAVCSEGDTSLALGLFERAMELREPLSDPGCRRDAANKLLKAALQRGGELA